MNYNILIIKTILKKDIYNKYNNILDDLIKETNNEIQKIYFVIKEYFKDKDNDLSLDDLIIKFYASYPAMRQKEKEVYESLFSIAKEAVVNDDLVEEYIQGLKKFVVANKLALAAIDYASGKKEYSSVKSLFEELGTEPSVGEVAPSFVSDDLEILLQEQTFNKGLRWRLQSLNHALGSLRRGDFGFVFARPETGKTTFLTSETTHMAAQAKANDLGPVVWFNNEEQGGKVKLRCIQAYFGAEIHKLRGNASDFRQKYLDEIGDYLRVVDEPILNARFVEKVVEYCKPSLIIFDQIDKVGGFSSDREDLRLGAIYQWSRELAKMYAPVIGITQSDASGEDKMWLTMDNVANAKTAKQAEADWILGIGFCHQPGMEYTRYMHLSKNKLIGDEDTKPENRHGKWATIIQPEIARYRDV